MSNLRINNLPPEKILSDKDFIMKTKGHDDYVAHIIGMAAFILLPLSHFAPLWIAPLLILVVVITAANLFITNRFAILPWKKIKKITILLVIFWIWCVCSLLWTIGYRETGIEIIRSGLLMAILPIIAWTYIGSDSSRISIGKYLFCGSCLGIILFLVQIFIDKTLLSIMFNQNFSISPLQQLNRAAAVLAVIMWPTVLWLWKKECRAIAVLFWAICLFILWRLDNETAFFAAASASLVALLVLIKPHVLIKLSSLFLFLAIVTAPIWPLTVLSPDRWLAFSCNYTASSLLHRLYIWQFAVKKTIEKPVTGWGLNTARIMPGGRDIINIRPPCESNWTSGESLPLHTHNAILQIWLELGGVGAFIFGIILVAINLGLQNANRFVAAFSQSQLTAAIVVSSLGFGAWQSWWLSLLWLSALIMASIRNENIVD